MEREYSLRHVLHMAYDRNSKEKNSSEFGYDFTNFDDVATNYYNKYYEIMDGLYCFVNDIDKPPEGSKPTRWIKDKKELKVDINAYTTCLILTLMTMKSNSSNTFISKLRNKRFDEITESDKQEYLEAYTDELKKIKLNYDDDFLQGEFGDYLLEKGENPNDKKALEKEIKHTISGLVDKVYSVNFYHTKLHNYIDTMLDSISSKIKSVLEYTFPNDKNLNVPFPINYAKNDEQLNPFPSSFIEKITDKDLKDPFFKFLLELPQNISIYFLPNDEIKYYNECHPSLEFDLREKEELLHQLQDEIENALANWLEYTKEYAREKKIENTNFVNENDDFTL